MKKINITAKVKVEKENKLIGAIIKIKNDVMTITFNNKEYSTPYRWHAYRTLRELDSSISKDGYHIICNGTSKYNLCHGFCINMAEGFRMYNFDPSTEERKVIDTFNYEDWNEYATEEEQRKILE